MSDSEMYPVQMYGCQLCGVVYNGVHVCSGGKRADLPASITVATRVEFPVSREEFDALRREVEALKAAFPLRFGPATVVYPTTGDPPAVRPWYPWDDA